jgi:hypothetical protein
MRVTIYFKNATSLFLSDIETCVFNSEIGEFKLIYKPNATRVVELLDVDEVQAVVKQLEDGETA